MLHRYQLKVLNVSLRNSSMLNSEDNHDSIVLGYVAHALQQISSILSMPLRYPVVFRGSRSFVLEPLGKASEESSATLGMREHALFKQSSEASLSSGITLLKKNLCQLRIAFDSHKNVDPNDMIGNLKWIMQKI